ncbi:MAG: hypothetical protein KAT05_15320 [Spirochaetes bacterium]|nr:hypothetical protein [Spirochaetota bacterium]
MYSTYKIKTSELDRSFIDGIKKMYRDHEIEIIIHDTEDEKLQNRTKQKSEINKKVFGRLHKYANPELISKEKGAWSIAVKEKYGLS